MEHLSNLVEWFSRNWVNALTIIGGASGYLAVHQARQDRIALQRSAMLDRLQVRTEQDGSDYLRVSFTFRAPSASEPYVVRVKVLEPQNVRAVYWGTTVKIASPSGAEVMDPSEKHFARSIEVPFHPADNGLVATLVHFTWDVGDVALKSCIAQVEIMTAASRKRLICEPMTFAA